MNHPEARQWAKDFENKDISELEALRPPPGMHTHVIRHWQKARFAAIGAGNAELSSARTVLARQIAARAEQLSAAPAQSADASSAADTPVESSRVEQEIEFHSAGRAENLRERIAAAIARNCERQPEPVFMPPQAPVILQRMPPLEAMEIQISSSTSMVEGMARQFQEQDFSAALTCEIMKSMAVLIAANAALGKVVYHFRGDAPDAGSAGRRSNAS